MTYLISIIFCFFIAVLVSILGLGGGFLYIPLFTSLGLDYKYTAMPMALLLNIAVTITAQSSYLKTRLTDIRTASIISVAAIIFAQIGVYINQYIPTDTLKIIFAIVIFASAIRIIFFDDTKKHEREAHKGSYPLKIVAGSAAGLLSGLLGVAGGFVVTPILLFMGFSTKKAAATSSFVVLFSSVSGFVGRFDTMEIDLKFAAVCVVSVIIGGKIGSLLMTKKLDSLLIKRLFGVVLIAIAIKFLIEAISSR